MMTTRDYMVEARDLIAQKRYDEAREILAEIDHPTARKWLAKLDEIDPPLLDDPFADIAEPEPIRPSSKSPNDKGELLGQFGVNVLEFIRRLLSGLFFGGAALFLTYVAMMGSGENVARTGILLMCACVFVVVLALLGNVAYTFLTDRKTLIYEHGIERKTLKGMEFYRFDDIDGVQGYFTSFSTYGITIGIMGSYKFYHGDTLLFGVYGMDQSFSQLSGYIIHKIEETHKARLLKAYGSGKTLHFKPLELRRDGLYHGKKHLPLNEFDGIEITTSSVKIGKRNSRAWKNFHISEVRNPWLLDAVMSSVTRS